MRLEHNGRDALRALAQSRPDVLVTDCVMPEMNGQELLRRLRSDPALATLPVILMSGADAHFAGIDRSHEVTLRKPFDPEELVELARKQVGEGAPRQ